MKTPRPNTTAPARAPMRKPQRLRAALASAALFTALPVLACDSSEPYLGAICTTAVNYCPEGYSVADGTMLQTSQNQALFSLLLNRYGGDGKTTFALPNLRGRSTLATLQGQNPGTQRGADAVILSASHLPSHSHAAIYSKFGGNAQLNAAIPVSSNTGANTQVAPDAAHSYLAGSPSGVQGAAAIWSSSMSQVTTIQGATATISGGNGVVTVAPAGASQPLPTLPPQLGLTYCIAVKGLYPSHP